MNKKKNLENLGNGLWLDEANKTIYVDDFSNNQIIGFFAINPQYSDYKKVSSNTIPRAINERAAKVKGKTLEDYTAELSASDKKLVDDSDYSVMNKKRYARILYIAAQIEDKDKKKAFLAKAMETKTETRKYKSGNTKQVTTWAYKFSEIMAPYKELQDLEDTFTVKEDDE